MQELQEIRFGKPSGLLIGLAALTLLLAALLLLPLFLISLGALAVIAVLFGLVALLAFAIRLIAYLVMPNPVLVMTPFELILGAPEDPASPRIHWQSITGVTLKNGKTLLIDISETDAQTLRRRPPTGA